MKNTIILSAILLATSAAYADEANEKSYTLVTPPDNVEISYYYATGWAGWRDGVESHTVSASYYLRVAFCDKEVYIQGLFDYAPDAWLHGSIDDKNMVQFKSNQYLGKAEIDEVNQGDCWLIEDYTMQLNPNDNSLAADNYAEARISVGESGYIERIGSIKMSKFDTGDADLTMVVPNEDTRYIDATFEAYKEDAPTGSKISWQGKVGICQDTIYLKNMFTWNDAWIRGIIDFEQGTITLPSGQHMGISHAERYRSYCSWFVVGEHYNFKKEVDLPLTIDAEGLVLSCSPSYCYELCVNPNNSGTSGTNVTTNLQITLDAPLTSPGSVGITATTQQRQSATSFDLFGHPIKGDASGQFVIQNGKIISR